MKPTEPTPPTPPRTLDELPPWTEAQWLRIATMLARGLEESRQDAAQQGGAQ